MKRIGRLLIAVLLTVVLSFSMVNTAIAKVNRVPVTTYEYDCFTGVEAEWFEGQVYHMRNVQHTNVNISSYPEVDGINTTTGDAEFNQITGNAVIRGKWSFQPNEIDGTWEGTWLFISNQGVSKATAIAKGTGELAGKTLFLTLYDAPYNPEIETVCSGIGYPEAVGYGEGYILDTTNP
jgi:hypothetical protein